MGAETLPSATESSDDDDTSQYGRFSSGRKTVMVIFLAWCGMLSPVSSTTVLCALPEVAASLHTTGTTLGLSNAVYVVFMAVSNLFWGPLSQVCGRRASCIGASALFLASSAATAASPNLPAFFVFRVLSAFAGTSFLALGPAVISDIYHPTRRATAVGWFLSGTLLGPTIGPVFGGLLVTASGWRTIFWMQTGMAAVACVGAVAILPETLPEREPMPWTEKMQMVGHRLNPFRVLGLLFRDPNLVLVAMASSSLTWSQYALLTPIRYVLNPRFHLSSPAQSGLFFLAPGMGYLIGTFIGGRWADWTVQRWMRKRGGRRVPEDRLRACTGFLVAVLPASTIVYGWSVARRVGGIPLPVIGMLLQGAAQSSTFAGLNTYCLDVRPGRGAEVLAGNFMMRYSFGAAGTAVALPAIEAIGVGWFSTVSGLFLLATGVGVWAVSRWSPRMRGWAEG